MGEKTKVLSYSLEGQGVVPKRSQRFIALLKKAGVVFPSHPRFGFPETGDKFFFHPAKEIDAATHQAAIDLLRDEHDIHGARLELCGRHDRK